MNADVLSFRVGRMMGEVRRAFTTIELAIVLVLAASIAAIAIPSILPAMRKSAVNKAADSIIAVAEEARRRARALEIPDAGFSLKDGTAGTAIRARGYDYGVKVEVPSDSSASAVVYLVDSNGSMVTDSTTGKPVMQRSLGNALPFTTVPIANGARLAFTPANSGSSVTWFYKRGTGQCCIGNINNPSLAEIGTGVATAGAAPDFDYHSRLGLTTAEIPAIANPSIYPQAYFGVCSADGRYGVGIAIFCSGLGYSQEIASGK